MMAENSPVTLARFLNSTEAHVIKGLLESEGIKAWLYDERGAAYTPFVVGGVRLAVRKSDLARATEIMSNTTSHDEDTGD